MQMKKISMALGAFFYVRAIRTGTVEWAFLQKA